MSESFAQPDLFQGMSHWSDQSTFDLTLSQMATQTILYQRTKQSVRIYTSLAVFKWRIHILYLADSPTEQYTILDDDSDDDVYAPYNPPPGNNAAARSAEDVQSSLSDVIIYSCYMGHLFTTVHIL